MIKKILFVLPHFGLGGTSSSLKNFLDVVCNKYDISIFSLSEQGESKFYFTTNNILPSISYLDLWHSNYKEFNSIKKIEVFSLKLIKRFCYFFSIDFEVLLYRLAAKNNIFRNYHTIIAFQEGSPTKFVSYLNCNIRIAWVHSNLKYSNIKTDNYISIYNKFNKVICVSKYTTQIFKELFPVNNVDFIYNVINWNSLIKDSQISDPHLLSFKDDYLIVSIGRINPIKQFYLIPSIAKRVHSKITNIKWLIIGDGDTFNSEQIRQEIKKNNCEDFVLLTGYKANVAPFLKRADLYVCTSESEACPMVFLEANALNTFVITNNFPSSYELLNKQTGLITTLDNLSDAIIDFFSNGPIAPMYNNQFFNESISKFESLLSR